MEASKRNEVALPEIRAHRFTRTCKATGEVSCELKAMGRGLHVGALQVHEIGGPAWVPASLQQVREEWSIFLIQLDNLQAQPCDSGIFPRIHLAFSTWEAGQLGFYLASLLKS